MYALSRAREHRVEMYRVLRARLGCHVVCFDYRGYADSSQEVMPTKRGVVTDGHRVYEHVASLAGRVDTIQIELSQLLNSSKIHFVVNKSAILVRFVSQLEAWVNLITLLEYP